ncbi:BCCT family transporter [Streptomyces iakyrus]|uniref:BCCT family transporter n=1 Tax=Streptomyces iakyrus TaxID=68219 RepID=UPI00382E3535
MLVGLFFVSGADAASVVLGMLSCRGSTSPGRPVVILWGTLTGLVAAVLLMAGGLEAVKQVAIIAAFVMIGLCVSLVKALRAEPTGASGPAREPEGTPTPRADRGRAPAWCRPRPWRTRSPRAEHPPSRSRTGRPLDPRCPPP